MLNCEIDITRLVELSISGDVHWCGDYFGLLKGNLIASDDPHKTVPISQIKNAVYVQDSISYWLTYYFASDAENDFLQTICYDDMITLSGYKGYTIYDKEEVDLLRTVLRNIVQDGLMQKPSAVIRTYDSYLQFWRELFAYYEAREKDTDAWVLADYVHRKHGDTGLDMGRYVRAHRCPVCGYYFTSSEYQCRKCQFDGINRDFISKKDYERWLADCVEPYKKKWENG